MLIAIDFETRRIDKDNIFPHPIVMSYWDGSGGVVGGLIRTKEDIVSLITSEKYTEIVAHNTKFELRVLADYFGLSKWIIDNIHKFRDTIISAKLHDLSTIGTTSKHKYSLDAVVLRYLNIDISSAKKKGSIRTSYDSLEHLHIDDWPQEAKDYALNDSKYTYELYNNHLKNYHCPISLAADFALSDSTKHGYAIDNKEVDKIIRIVKDNTHKAKSTLVSRGFADINKKTGEINKKLGALRDHLKNKLGCTDTTDRGIVKVDREVLKKYAGADSIVDAFLTISNNTKLESTYLPALSNTDTIRTNYNILVDTGRTSSFGSDLYPSCNLQNFPRGMGVRECLVPRLGYVFVSIDYGALELCSVAQQLYNLYGYSTHRDQLNAGDSPTDLHSFLGAKIMSNATGVNITYDEFIRRKNLNDKEVKKFRTLAKPVGLGFPGGLGPQTMIEFAYTGYGVVLTLDDATKLRDLFYEAYPDFTRFLKVDSRSYKTGKRYYDKDSNRVVEEYSYIVNGRKRAGCSFTNFTNGMLMQSLSADGAKSAVWDCYKFLIDNDVDGRIVNFIHDEIMFEMRYDIETIEKLSYIMIDSMQKHMPDIRITVEASVMEERWTKDGPFKFESKYWRDQR